jgi:acyl-phosphate glycerol 3-phosphate acyltransferase
MNSLAVSITLVLAAYLLGAIPFAYLVVYAVKRVDIRTVGSGNVGATNAGRVLGFKYFLLVFVMDFAKGWAPTFFFPRLSESLSGISTPSLAVFVALATILGHNFPIYLRFKGGKGVATSLGAVTALDPVASLCTFIAFVVFLGFSRFVSLSSILAATVFVVVHFARTPKPFVRSNVAMSVVTILLWGMLMVRHRKNFGRIADGTEPKVQFRRRPKPPAGRVRVLIVGVLLLATVVGVVISRVTRTRTLDCGAFVLAPVGRVSTGHQRAERLTFADGGRLLGVTCPRYNRFVVYRVSDDAKLELAADVDVEGRAMSVWPMRDRFLVLVRPAGDARHVEAGWLQAVDWQGRKIGSKFRVGFDPDDIAATPDGQWAFAILSGNAEGESNRPAPEMVAIDLRVPEQPRIAGRLSFDGEGDNPDRISLSDSGRRAAVSLLGSNRVAAIDLEEPERPRLIARQFLPPLDLPYPSLDADDWIMMPAGSERDAVLITLPGEPGPDRALRGSYLIGTLPEGSGIEVVHAARRKSLGRLPLRGAANLGTIHPYGIAYTPERSLIAVSNRSGGTVHLIAIQAKGGSRTNATEVAAHIR